MTAEMRRFLLLAVVVLAVAPAASAAAPRFAVYDLQTDLAHASRNPYGDVQVRPHAALAGKGTLVRCGTWCRFGPGWLAFRATSRLAPGGVSRASVRYTKHKGWTVQLALNRPAAASWTRLARQLKAGARLRGVPDVLVVTVGDRIAAAPFATQVTASGGTLTLTGFSRASAKALENALKR
jgi:hypothetical protein